MNSDDERSVPRWVRDGLEQLPSTAELAVIDEVLRAMRSVRYGAVQVTIQDGRPVQVETTEKKRL